MNNKFRIEYLPIAEKDLTEILEYIQIDNPTAALNLLNEIDEAISKLSHFPYIGSIPKDQRLILLNYRMLIVANYLVFYVVLDEENVVEIRRVLHGKRKYDFLV
ncbi:addiction module toxin, RelE/StbE family [Desulfitobacterium dichloroeliminans LMG P-21439]|uniref:Addiction module toxin, RelE/StbE family n=1 Tax=Desulfitobacterium dichloroeliminans (strain LMG P-21439 / DCA1) TaxID=871963 RepID=L0F303_DESDL|nr:type II toxin-antitoxin system RelE/ParE family toxin [Desulfitobacterium dichloroeliminans]AGA68229.1 addiction module toxin, RelE/StbE family [Desulfitobacterium dichloroeliminans LMG P-21439]